MSSKAERAFPGLCLGSVLDYKPVGKNLYVYLDKIYSSVKGSIIYIADTVEVLTKDDISNAKQIVDLENVDMDAKQEQTNLVPKEGCEVYARVDKVEDRFVRVKILAINEKPLPGNTQFTGMIFKENVRDYDRDGIMMHKCFVPNDIVKARVI